MSCVTCETTPPPERQSATRVHEGHVGQRFGDGGLGWHIVFNGRNVTLQCVEALAGDHDSGWVELYLLTDDGAPHHHPATDYRCPCCHDDDVDPGADTCPHCNTDAAPEPDTPPHPVTVIRRGHVVVVHGTHILAPPQHEDSSAD